jgi:hypothetical protein
MYTKAAKVFLIIVPLLGLYTFFIDPFWPFRFSSRPMFNDWVGASHTAWGRILPVRDSSTWAYFDNELSICVIVAGKPDIDYDPLEHASASESVFVIDEEKTKVSASDHNSLIILKAGHIRSQFPLQKDQMMAMQLGLRDAIDEATPFRLLHVLKDLYKGPDRPRFLRAIGSVAGADESREAGVVQ